MNKIFAEQSSQINKVNFTGCTHFPQKKQIISLSILLIFQLESILTKIPFQTSSLLIVFLITQIILAIVIIYSWYLTLSIHPGQCQDLSQFQFANFQQINRKIKRNNNKSQDDKLQICEVCKVKLNQTISHCKRCNRCVQGYYFHVSWLNTCIGKSNFVSFISLISFILIYQIVALSSNIFVLVRNNKNEPFQRENYKLQTFQTCIRIVNEIFVGLIFILIIISIVIITLQKQRLKKHNKNKNKKQATKIIAQKSKENQRKQSKKQKYFNSQMTQTAFQIDSIKQLQFHQTTLHSLQYKQPQLFKTNFFSSSSYFNHKKESLQLKNNQFQIKINSNFFKLKEGKSKKQSSRSHLDSFQSQNLKLKQLLQVQKQKQDRIQIKTSKLCKQPINKVQLDQIKTKFNINPGKDQTILPSTLGYKVIQGKRNSIRKMLKVDQKYTPRKINLFNIKKRDSVQFQQQRVKNGHRLSNISN